MSRSKKPLNGIGFNSRRGFFDSVYPLSSDKEYRYHTIRSKDDDETIKSRFGDFFPSNSDFHDWDSTFSEKVEKKKIEEKIEEKEKKKNPEDKSEEKIEDKDIFKKSLSLNPLEDCSHRVIKVVKKIINDDIINNGNVLVTITCEMCNLVAENVETISEEEIAEIFSDSQISEERFFS